MRMKLALYSILVILLTAFLTAPPVFAQAQHSIWDDFIAEPNAAHYQAIIARMQSMDEQERLRHQKPEALIGENSRGFVSSLYGLVRQGDYDACHLAFDFADFFRNNAAFVESLNDLRGEIINVNPDLFLELIHKYAIKDPRHLRLSSIVTATGDQYVDEFEKTIQENNKRIASLKTVKSGAYSEEKDLCIQLLEENNERYKKVIKKFENQAVE
ncbi:hypothetical protein Dalk_2146 [Desulfatibacillum aliphaticivorans]|uniref:Uncharacterized protein n=1 Tax=Desulfatibacillum aliphaticivorans TaxID=218208 RepID=B8FF23_DESAL|nr:hypothetical protein [Desulfatibacillum aliphaticivorans]ACL03840.1 hypothetical protein Dalk_2146 [Desulfatibacillum aliphaticivorans]